MKMKFLGCMGGWSNTFHHATSTVCSGGAGQMQSVLDGFCTCKTGIEPCYTVPVYCNSPCTGHYYWWCVMHTATWLNATFCICQLSHRWDTFEQHIEDSSLLGFQTVYTGVCMTGIFISTVVRIPNLATLI